MRLALVFPPFTDATQPYSSLPALAAVARRAGHDVVPVDANLELVRSLLTAERVREAGECLHEQLGRLAAVRPESGPETERYAHLAAACLKVRAVADGIDEAVVALGRAATFRDLGTLAAAKRRVDEALEIHTLAWPRGLGMGAPAVPELGWPAAITAWAADADRNPFLRFLETVTLPRLETVGPRAVGISITYRSQVLPAVTLAQLVRRHLPEVPVIFGGSLVSRWHDGIEHVPEVFDWCSYLVAFEGESALVGLLAALDGEGELEAVPNLAFRRDGRVICTPVSGEDVNALPTPDFTGLPLADYLAPEPVFLLGTSRGCYWRRCSFCSVSPATGLRYRRRHPDRVHEDVQTLVARHGARCISLGDDCVAPATLRALAARLRDKGPRVSWQCEVRFERALDRPLLEELAAAGCRNLIFGLESAAPRVLERMGKGVRPADVPPILADCRRAGIAFNLQLFFGFPGETEEDAEATADFVSKEMHGAATCSFGLFELQKGAPVERDPAGFGIRHVGRDGGPLAVRYDYAPVPEHAAPVRERLRRRIARRTRHLHAGLSINAHTLVFLHEAGVEALGGLYGDEREDRRPEDRLVPEADALMERALAPSGRHQALALPWLPADLLADDRWEASTAPASGAGGVILLYDDATGRTIQVPRLALWLLGQLDGAATPAALAARLAEETGESAAAIHGTVQRIVGELVGRGFLVGASG